MTPSDSTPLPDASAQAEAAVQQYGYVRVYRAVVHQCGIPAAYLYGILEDYVQLGARTGRGCVPSHNHLADLMKCSRRSIVSYMQELRDKGWLEWDEDNTGTPNAYRLPVRKKLTPPVQDLHTTYAKSAHNQEQEIKNNSAISETTSPLAPSGGVYTPEFEEFWKAYGKTNGAKKPAFSGWQRLSKENKAKAIDMLPAWIAHWDVAGYKVWPQRYLNDRFFENAPVKEDKPQTTSKNGNKGLGPRDMIRVADHMAETGANIHDAFSYIKGTK